VTRTSKVIKGTRRSDGAQETERRKGTKKSWGSKAMGKNLIHDHFEYMRMYESPFQFGWFFSVSIPKKASH
jgi:hypothetical protein